MPLVAALNCLDVPVWSDAFAFFVVLQLKDMEEGIVTKLCLKMRPYLALEDDIIVKEGEVGEEMYMVVRGTIKLQSDTWRQYNERNWVDGAFFGELTVLGIGAGSEHNRHVYSATAAEESECIYITQDSMDTLQILHPAFKYKMRTMAAKRAERFGYGERGAVRIVGEDGELTEESPGETTHRPSLRGVVRAAKVCSLPPPLALSPAMDPINR